MCNGHALKNFLVIFLMFLGWWVTVYITLTDVSDDNFSFKCKTSFSAVSTADSATTAGAAIIGAGILAFMLARRRRVGKIDLIKEEQAVAEGHFEMMSDNGVRV